MSHDSDFSSDPTSLYTHEFEETLERSGTSVAEDIMSQGLKILGGDGISTVTPLELGLESNTQQGQILRKIAKERKQTIYFTNQELKPKGIILKALPTAEGAQIQIAKERSRSGISVPEQQRLDTIVHYYNEE